MNTRIFSGPPDTLESRSAAKVCTATDAPRLAAARHAWFLDVDGTLAEIADTPDAVKMDAAVIGMLERLAGICGGAVALISGRRLKEMDRLAAPLRLPSAGQHGMELRTWTGKIHRHRSRSDFLRRVRTVIGLWAAHRPGILLEDKGMTLAVHFRRVPHLHAEAESFLRGLMNAGRGEYQLQPGKMVYEIKPVGWDKGTAVREFMIEPPFRGRTPVVLGDDDTDEYAFSAVNDLGGVSVKVGQGDSVARWRLQDVASVHAWIAATLERS